MIATLRKFISNFSREKFAARYSRYSAMLQCSIATAVRLVRFKLRSNGKERSHARKAHGQGKAQGHAHRARLREARSFQEGIRTSGLGNRQQTGKVSQSL